MNITEAVEIVSKYHTYDGTEYGELSEMLLAFHESPYMSERLQKAIAYEIMCQAKEYNKLKIVTKKEMVEREYSYLEEK